MKEWRWHLLFAAMAGLALRLFFALHFPATSSDTAIYEDLAANWLKYGVYGMTVQGRLVPTDMRMPGYPAFLALVYAATGRAGAAARPFVMLTQAAIDLGTCLLIGLLASLLAPEKRRRLASIAGLWLAATCPLLANYVAVPLTEILATFLTTWALLMFVMVLKGGESGGNDVADRHENLREMKSAVFGAILVGFAALLRPESPLLLIAFLIFLAWQSRRGSRWKHFAMVATVMMSFFVIPLLPWAARNAITLHKLEFVAPRYPQLPGEIIAQGFYAWERTWLVRVRDAYLVAWKLDAEPILIDDIPSSAFDSPNERERVAALLAQHNRALSLTEGIDKGFAALAAERTARHPFRTIVGVPLQRALAMWFTPRIELLPYSGKLRPLAKSWSEDPVDVRVTLGLFLLGVTYVALGVLGAFRLWRWPGSQSTGPHSAVAFIALFIVTRTAFLTTVEVPEPRYVLECFPPLLAIAAFSFLRRARDEW